MWQALQRCTMLLLVCWKITWNWLGGNYRTTCVFSSAVGLSPSSRPTCPWKRLDSPGCVTRAGHFILHFRVWQGFRGCQHCWGTNNTTIFFLALIKQDMIVYFRKPTTHQWCQKLHVPWCALHGAPHLNPQHHLPSQEGPDASSNYPLLHSPRTPSVKISWPFVYLISFGTAILQTIRPYRG